MLLAWIVQPCRLQRHGGMNVIVQQRCGCLTTVQQSNNKPKPCSHWQGPAPTGQGSSYRRSKIICAVAPRVLTSSCVKRCAAMTSLSIRVRGEPGSKPTAFKTPHMRITTCGHHARAWAYLRHELAAWQTVYCTSAACRTVTQQGQQATAGDPRRPDMVATCFDRL
jgi:hypothetical protein